MADKDKIQLTFVIVAAPVQAAEGDRLFQSHAQWMERTHHRTGDKALLTYNVSKASELSNPMDPTSASTGNACFILSEIYETEEGVTDHFEQAKASWEDLPAFVSWLKQCQVTAVPAAKVFHSLW